MKFNCYLNLAELSADDPASLKENNRLRRSPSYTIFVFFRFDIMVTHLPYPVNDFFTQAGISTITAATEKLSRLYLATQLIYPLIILDGRRTIRKTFSC